MRSFYGNSVRGFINQSTIAIVGELTTGASDAGFFQQQHSQTDAWRSEIEILKEILQNFFHSSQDWFILLEYTIPRRAKRVDAVLLAEDLIFVIEFKIGSSSFQSNDIAQVEDYALDLRDFHFQSKDRTIIPILVATSAPNGTSKTAYRGDKEDCVKQTKLTTSNSLGDEIAAAFEEYHIASSPPIEYSLWKESDYRPTPTIIEAAQVLYAGKDVKEISRSHADIENLTATTEAVLEAVETARASGTKLACFITGVPGAGKTLAGLNIVHNNALHDKDLGVFLSGNGPLVKVLSEALARDHSRRNDVSKRAARRKVSTFIQNVHQFLDTYFGNKAIPVDKVVIFDEAQRAWNAEQSHRKFKRGFSEPEMMLEIMDRHDDWAVIVALVGGGQEINTGEAGLSEWGKTLLEKFPHWKIQISPQLLSGHHATGGQCLFDEVPNNLEITRNDALHLKVSLRAFRAERHSDFVAKLLDLQLQECAGILRTDLQDYPIYWTRELNQAKEWLRSKQRGSRRIGMIASSGARRIKRFGFDVREQLDVANWFLNPPDDVRSSYYLEDAATEFAVQGLELDWVCICWGADFRHNGRNWTYRRFRGSSWQNVNVPQTREYMKNKYRVLLTRAREGMVIWVPPGDSNDRTSLPTFYDSTAAYLARCGIPELPV